MKEPRDPFDFYMSPWWKDAHHQLCRDGWPTYVVAVNCMVRDAKSAYDVLAARVKELERAVEYSIQGLHMFKKYGSPGNVAEVEQVLKEALAKSKGGEDE